MTRSKRLTYSEPHLSTFRWKDLFRAYWFLLDAMRWKWLWLMAVLFVITFYALVPPFILGGIVDFFTSYRVGDSLQRFYGYTAFLGISFVVVSFIRLTTKNVIGNLQSEVIYQTKVKGFEKLLDFSLAWHLEESAGVKAQRIMSGVEAYRTFNHRLTNEIMRSVTSVLGVVVVFLFLRPHYVIFFVSYVVGFWLILTYFYKRIQRENDSYYFSVEQAGGSYMEGLSNILTIKTLGAGGGFKKHIAGKEQVTKVHDLTIRRLHTGVWKCFQIFNGVCYASFLFLVGNDVVRQNISAGSLVVFYGYLQSLITNAADMIDTYETTLNAKSGIGRMMSIFWAPASIGEGKKKLPQRWDAITLDGAQFRYDAGGRGALKNMSIQIPRYAKIGVVGKTGSGKSTLAKVLAGLYPLSEGRYAIGGVSFYDLTHAEQSKQLTLVLQETEIFNLSFEDNITLLHAIDPALLDKALRLSQLEELVEKLPEGLNTIVGEKGYHLSGGERQRIGIARAICKDAPIIILDEATSSLDSKTELLIQEALETMLKDKTIISIAHRVSTLQKTSRMYVFDEGAIVEEGTFAQLSKDPQSKFYELYQHQQTRK